MQFKYGLIKKGSILNEKLIQKMAKKYPQCAVYSWKRSVNRQDVQVIQFLVSVNSKGKAKEEGAWSD